jgi:hypothetical protein
MGLSNRQGPVLCCPEGPEGVKRPMRCPSCSFEHDEEAQFCKEGSTLLVWICLNDGRVSQSATPVACLRGLSRSGEEPQLEVSG